MQPASTLMSSVTDFIQQHRLIKHGDIIIVGLSGGPDSVFLLKTLMLIKDAYNLKLIAAHLNHEWRNDADQDELFCKQLAANCALEYTTMRASAMILNRKPNGSQEEHGRLLRRQFFEQAMQHYGATSIALAHHRDDQYETFFIRLLRGASLTGLASIRPQNGHYIHPLLTVSKESILAYLQHNNINYCIDPTNKSNAYLRNNVRSMVLPALVSCDRRFTTTFERTLQQLQETECFLETLAENIFNTITRKQDNTLLLDLLAFRTLDHVLQKRIVMHWLCHANVPFTPSQGFLKEVINFLLSLQGGTHKLGTSWLIRKKKSTAFIVS